MHTFYLSFLIGLFPILVLAHPQDEVPVSAGGRPVTTRSLPVEKTASFLVVFEYNTPEIKEYCEDDFRRHLKKTNPQIELECKKSDDYRISVNGKTIFPTEADHKTIKNGGRVGGNEMIDRLVWERELWLHRTAEKVRSNPNKLQVIVEYGKDNKEFKDFFDKSLKSPEEGRPDVQVSFVPKEKGTHFEIKAGDKVVFGWEGDQFKRQDDRKETLAELDQAIKVWRQNRAKAASLELKGKDFSGITIKIVVCKT